jgi:threonine dehydratase
MPVDLAAIQAARVRLDDDIYHSPCPYSLSLSRLCGAKVYCKLDHLQMTGSFKERGARNKLLQLTAAERAAGVIAASAGNHALALAYHGQLLNVPVTVVMPRFAPLVKVSNCRSFGAAVIQHGESYDAARRQALALARERGQTYIPGFDDPAIIAGAGTMGLEILEDVPGVEAILVPVGGGGLIAGVATAVKALRPEVRVIGVEPVNAPTLAESLARGALTRVETRPTLADGLGVAEAGTHCLALARRHVDRVVLVDESAIAKAVLRLVELEKMVIEGAGAVGLAALMRRRELGLTDLEGKTVVLALCGGNIDVTTLSRVINRGLADDGRLARITADISDRPGGLARLLAVIAEAGGSILEVRHDRHFGPADVALARVYLVIETRDAEHIAEIGRALGAAGVMVQPTEGDGASAAGS